MYTIYITLRYVKELVYIIFPRNVTNASKYVRSTHSSLHVKNEKGFFGFLLKHLILNCTDDFGFFIATYLRYMIFIARICLIK